MPCQPLLGDRHPPRRRATATLDRSFTLAAQLGRRPFRAAHVSERSSDAATQQEGTWRTQSTAPPARRALSKQERGARRVPLRDTKRNRAMTPTQARCLASRFWDRHPPRRRATATLDRSFTLAAQLGQRPFRAANVSERSSDAATQQEGTWRTQSTAPPARRALSKQERGARRVPLRDTKRNRAMTPTQARCLASRFWDRHPPRRRATATLDRSFTLAAQLGQRPFRAANVSERSSDAATQQEGTWRTQGIAPPARRALSRKERGARRELLSGT